MNRTETIKIMAVLRAAYPQYYARQNAQELQDIVNLWAEMFSDEPYSLVAMAVKALIKTRVSTFPPGIGEITEKIMQLTKPDEMTEVEAWVLVSKALKNSGYGSREEFEKLPPVIQRIIGSHHQLQEWSQLDQDEVATVVASNFQRSYRARAKSEREFLALPADVRDFMVQLASGMDIRQMGGGKKKTDDFERIVPAVLPEPGNRDGPAETVGTGAAGSAGGASAGRTASWRDPAGQRGDVRGGDRRPSGDHRGQASAVPV